MSVDYLLQESGSLIALEDGSGYLLLESSTVPDVLPKFSTAVIEVPARPTATITKE